MSLTADASGNVRARSIHPQGSSHYRETLWNPDQRQPGQPGSPIAGEELKTWRNRSLDEVMYLYLDARYEKVRQVGSVRDAAILMAIGVISDRRSSILGVRVSERS